MIKGYTLDKNEKKLIHQRKYIFLTEREILLELLLETNSAVSKKDILKKFGITLKARTRIQLKLIFIG